MYKELLNDTKSLLKTGVECQPLHVTLTIKDVTAEQIPEAIDFLKQGWERLMSENQAYKDNVKGFFRSIDVTYNDKCKLCHPHIHALWSVSLDSPHISKEQLKLDWAKALSLDYSPVVSFDYLY